VVIIPEHKKEEKKEEHHKTEHHEHKKSDSGMLYKFMVIGALFFVIGLSAGWIASPKTVISGQPVNVDKIMVGQTVVKFINDNFVTPGTSANLSSVEEENGMYKVTTNYQGQQVPVYATADGKMLFVSQPVPLNFTKPKEPESAKVDRPKVELFVMSFCPYGVQAEQIMKPVYDILGNYSDIEVRFIANVGGDRPQDVDSLHGTNEAMEDMRQLCIAKYYGKDKLWTYLNDFDAGCYSTYRDSAALNTCWKGVADKYGINTTKIEDCVNTEGVQMMRAEEALTAQYGVSGSPTVVINGVTYSGARSSSAFFDAICATFNTPPAVCGTTVSSTDAAAQGNC
jgi:glutaredoxin